LYCFDPLHRQWEWWLRAQMVHAGQFRDDTVVTSVLNIPWQISSSGYGIDIPSYHHSTGEARSMAAVLTKLPDDLERLRFPHWHVDRTATRELLARAEDLFDGLLTPRIRMSYPISADIFSTVGCLLGMEQLILAPYDNPAGLHALLAWLAEDRRRYAEWLVRENLLTLNNENELVMSSGMSYATELPASDYVVGAPVRLHDVWGYAASQETVGWSPEMFREFSFTYEEPLLRRCGLVSYGCCEALHDRLDVLFTLPNLRRVSVSPWADQTVCAELLGSRYVACRRPNPALICASFSESAIRQNLRVTLCLAQQYGMNMEICMKDLHTVQGEPWRIGRWVEIAREEISRIYGT
jgi:hypothetical protein